MNRREAVSAFALLLGGTMIGNDLFLSGCKPAGRKSALTDFTEGEISLLDEIAETIIPATNTPGAKAAKLGEFMKRMVTDCYDEQNQKIFVEGMVKIDAAGEKAFGKKFLKLDPKQQKELLVAIDEEQKAYAKAKKSDDPPHYFTLMKELTIQGYFTSEIGAEQALRYVPVPGRYEGCIPYKKGDRAWAT